MFEVDGGWICREKVMRRAGFFKERDESPQLRREIEDGFMDRSTSNDHEVPSNMWYEAKRV